MFLLTLVLLSMYLYLVAKVDVYRYTRSIVLTTWVNLLVVNSNSVRRADNSK